MAVYTYEDEKARKLAAKEPLNYGKKPVTPPAATTPKPVGGIPAPTTGIPKPAVTPPVAASPTTPKGVIPPAYGANVAGYDSSNAGQTALADAGQAWWAAKAAGDTAGMTAAAAKGADIRAQGGIPASFNSKTGVTTFTPVEQKVADPLPNVNMPPNYMDIANGENAYELARQNARAEEEKASLTSAYGRANQIQKDNRVLGDFTRTQSANPFANMGRRSFDEGLIGRERTLQDESAQGTYNAGIKGIDQGLTDFENTAAQEARARAYALEQDAKNYDLQYAQTYGQGQNGGPRTVAATSAALNDQGQALTNQLAQLQLEDYPEQAKQQAQLLAQQVKSGQIGIDTATYQLNELKNPNSVSNQAAALDLKMKQLEANNLPETQKLQLQQLRKSIANIGRTAPTSDYDKQMQDIKLKTAQAEYDKLVNAKPGYKDNPNFANAVQGVSTDPNALSKIKQNAEKLINDFGIDGYNELVKLATPDKKSTNDLFSELFQ